MKKLLTIILTTLCASCASNVIYAQEITIKDKCSAFTYGSESGWTCYNKSQGIDPEIRLEKLEQALSKVKNPKKYDLKYYLIDPICKKDSCEYKSYVKGKKVFFAVMDCPKDARIGKALIKKAIKN